MSASVTKLDYSATGYFTPLVLDYLRGAEELKEFYALAPELNSFPAAILEKQKQNVERGILVEALKNQYGDSLIADSPTHKNISALLNENTFTVTTAHQPNLFLGPLYLIYKIISAIKLSEVLNEKFPLQKFVPVYWLGSEDHDFDELNHIQLFGKKIVWDTNQKGSFGKYVPENLEPLIEELKNISGSAPHAEELIELLRSCYLQSKNITEATRKILHHFFGEHGLVIVDGDDASLKKLFSQVMKDELLNGNSEKIVSATISKLEAKHKVQVQPRPINLFYNIENLRERITREGAEWKVLNSDISFSKAELETELQNHPEHFSPNVVLRPLYQEMILPNVAFIGGGAEVSYFLELKKLFANYQIAFPIVLLRDSALLIDKTSAQRLNKLGINAEALFQDEEEIIKSFTKEKSGDAIQLNAEQKLLDEFFQALKSRTDIQSNIPGAQLEAEQVRMKKFIQSLEERLLKAEKKKHEDSINQIRTLKAKLFPSDSLQERNESFIGFYLTYGKEFFNVLHDAFNPLEKKFSVIELK